MSDYDMDALSALQDIVEECINGRTEGHKCPFCKDGVLKATVVEDVSVRLECSSCRKFFEGKLA